MSIHGMSTNAETLLFLAWATRIDLRERMIKVHQERRSDAAAPERVLRGEIKYSQPPVFEEDSVYGPVYEALFNYRLDRVEYSLVDWALRGEHAVYLKASDAAAPNDEDDYSTPETGILWQSIAEDDRLMFRVKSIGRDWHETPDQVANALRLYFTFRTPLLMRTPESCFLFHEFISMSLERVNWVELASLVLDIPYQPGAMLSEEAKDGDYEAMQLALLKEMVWRGYVDFGEFSNHPLFSRQLHELCLNLAGVCYNTHGALRQLEESHSIYDQHIRQK
ncbi:hypothetical protein KDA_76620 [Dictyobacter alpinus]|uniref:Uncharacterized protein n=1 Tax=Dictyobacter alpinus TaxID=2014873 RepID=A0A402BLD4_9CHLR|nr:hypothetical protein [Dictyobacter alpinus]GCE32178.1 hypothetical protein KDA_76620 [Dictyobacter alpinus]